MNANQALVGAAISAKDEVKEAEIPHIAQCVEKQIAELEELQKVLWQRLQCVMRQEPGVDEGNSQTPGGRVIGTDFGARLGEADHRICKINDGFRRMLYVLEL